MQKVFMKKLMYFTASWCGPCKMVKPIVQKLIDEGLNIEKIDLDQNEDKARTYGIAAVPTFVLFDGDEEIGRVSGLPTEDDIRGWFK